MENQTDAGGTPSQQSPIMEALTQLDRDIDVLGKNIDTLAKRLGTILTTPEELKNEHSGKEPIGGNSPLAQRINKAADAINCITSCVRDTTNRLQL